MGSLNPDAEPKQELDDSGYVQEEGSKPALDSYKGTAELLDLSDDVLLYIFKNCSPQDLKALGFSCARLGTLVLDRTLWVNVDACSAPLGRQRVRWLLTRALGPHTKRLRLKGYAEEADGCLGYANRRLPDNTTGRVPQEEERYLCGGPRVYRLTQSMPRFGNGAPSAAPSKCVGPRLTLTHTALRALGERCPSLTTLELEYCVIDCQTTNIGLFPKTLKKLSLKGTKCFNLESKSFLFKIQDHLSELEELDVSYCSWIEPACMLPLSKMPKLRSLAMRECHKLAEFVAYASLATRYGFKTLEHLDLRGSPVGDSEVSALGWLGSLTSLLLSPAPATSIPSDHAHYVQDLLPAEKELEEWEEKEPDYFKPPTISEAEWTRDEDDVRGNRTRARRVLHYANCDDPTACILLERMIAEPVNPEEYSQVYHQFLAGHNNNVPLANPDQYRESYRRFMERPMHGHPPAGYSLFIRKAEVEDETGASKRRKCHDYDLPGTSTEDAKPSTSGESKPKPEKQDSDDDSDPKTPEPKKERRTRWGPEKSEQKNEKNEGKNGGMNDSDSDSDGPSRKHRKKSKKSKKDEDRCQPRRVFEITINELLNRSQYNTNERNEPRRGASNNGNEARDNGNASNDGNVASNDGNEVSERGNVASNDGNVASNDGNIANNNGEEASGNLGNEASNSSNVASNDGNIASNIGNTASDNGNEESKRGNVASNESNVASDIGNVASNRGSVDGNVANNDGNGTSNDGNGASGNGNVASNDGNVASNDGNVASNDGNGEPRCGNEKPRRRSVASNNGNEASNNGNEIRESVRHQSCQTVDLIPCDAGTLVVDSAIQTEIIRPGRRTIIRRSRQRSRDQSRADPTPGTSKSANKSNSNEKSEKSIQDREERRDDRRIFQFRQYRRPIVIEEFINVGDPEAPGVLPRGVLFPGCPTRLDPAALVSDSSIRRFGRAIGENINYIHIGGGARDANARPDRSNLRELSVTGFRHVTDASLTHLATAAPFLQRLDVRGTSVTLDAVERFRALRPDVEVITDGN